MNEEIDVDEIAEAIDTSSFEKEVNKHSAKEQKEYTTEDLLEILGQTVKKDNFNKLLVFLCQLLAFTDDSQINVSFNAPSSSGKSYLALEISELFPKENVIKLGYASPTSFFHTTSKYDKDRKGFVVDLENKILIFLDMPHASLLQHLRPLLSHDEKEMLVKITDKSKKGGIKTKDVYIRGYPSVLFCSASFNLDEQELTRFILLSPETNQEKLRESLLERIKKEADKESYYRELNSDPKRQALMRRIRAIRDSGAKRINLDNPKKLSQMFYERNKVLKPRHSRDIQRISSLTKGFALLNLWNRERKGMTVMTNDKDLENAFSIWDKVSEAQDLGVSPYVFNLYKEIIKPAFVEKGSSGLSRQDIIEKHYKIYGRHLSDWQFRQEILPMMKTSGLIKEEKDPLDGRRLLMFPLFQVSTKTNVEDLTTNEVLDIFS